MTRRPAYEPITEHADRCEQTADNFAIFAAEQEARAMHFRAKEREWRDKAMELRRSGAA